MANGATAGHVSKRIRGASCPGVPEVKPVTSLPLQVAQAEAAAAPIKVRVNKPYRVVHDGKVYLGGQTLTVPNDLIHARWLDAGWVTKVKGSK
jgi:hypothetical protein